MNIYVVVEVDICEYYPSGDADILYVGERYDEAKVIYETQYQKRVVNKDEYMLWIESWEDGKLIEKVLRQCTFDDIFK